jgi:hypothetical protein
MANIITVSLPHDLPENWTDNQYVSPGGVEVGLTEKHGYNYLMKQVNKAHMAINELDEGALKSGGSFDIISSAPTVLSKAGWYRLATFERGPDAPVNALLSMGNIFNNGGASSLLASVSVYEYAPSIVVLNHAFNNQLFFGKLRIVKSTTLNQVYLDFFYAKDLENFVSAGLLTFSYSSDWAQRMNEFTPITQLGSDESIVLEQSLETVPNGAVITTGSAVVPATLE